MGHTWNTSFHSSFLSYKHSVGLLKWEISPLQGGYLHRTTWTQHKCRYMVSTCPLFQISFCLLIWLLYRTVFRSCSKFSVFISTATYIFKLHGFHCYQSVVMIYKSLHMTWGWRHLLPLALSLNMECSIRRDIFCIFWKYGNIKLLTDSLVMGLWGDKVAHVCDIL